MKSADPRACYKFGQLLGSGAFGQVHQVERKERTAGGALAIKSIDTAGNRCTDEMLFREIGAMMRCEHPHLIGIVDAYKWKATLYVVMDLVPRPEGCASSPDLFSWLTEPSGLGAGQASEEQVATIVHHVADALLYLKTEMGALHRDLKPENVSHVWAVSELRARIQVLVGPGGIDQLKLTDFGLARLGVEADSGFVGTYRAGTEGYTAPELLDSSKAVDGQIDYGTDPHKVDVSGRLECCWADREGQVFSLGVIMFICFVKSPPFGLGPGASKAVLAGEYSFAHPEWRRVSAGGKTMVESMLECNQEKRAAIEEVLSHSWLKQTYNG